MKSNQVPAPQPMFEVTYNYNYDGKVFPYQEEMTESQLRRMEKYITDGGVNQFGSFYSNLVIVKELGMTDVSNLEIWLEIGMKNPWIVRANDPTFTYNSFSECKSLDYLISKLESGNWCQGQAFYYKNMCFIQQVDSGDEWLVIRGGIKFESWSCGRVIREDGKEKFINQLNRMFAATDQQLRTLEYMDAGEVSYCEHCTNKMFPGCDKIYLRGTTCEDCYISKKLHLQAIVDKVKSGERLVKSDLKYLGYRDSFFGIGKGMENNRGLIFWDTEVAIGYPYGERDSLEITIYKPISGNGNPTQLQWQLVDEYKAEEDK
ncbi:hypothetical protein [Paenibacillus sp. MMO-58]|uniref:hypothetical protein n=1 Tax=Paenibacillus sp. MMO-58 TaxID=3081290 RepID=UPI00301AEC40